MILATITAGFRRTERATHLVAIQWQSTDTVRAVVRLVPNSRRGELLHVPLSWGAVVVWGVGWAGHE